MTEDGRCWRALPHSPSARSAVSPVWREAASALRAGTVRGGHFFTPSHKQHPRHTANEKKRQRPEVQTRETESRPSSVLHMHSGHLLPLRSWDSQPGSGGRGSVRLAWPSRIPADAGSGATGPHLLGEPRNPRHWLRKRAEPAARRRKPHGCPTGGAGPKS